MGGLAEDPSGDLAFGASGDSPGNSPGNDVVWVVMGRSGRFFGRAMTAGDSYPVAGAGGPAAKVTFHSVGGTAFDHSGNVLVADTQANLVRVIAVRTGRFYGQAMTAGHAYIVAGTGAAGFSGNGGPARKAKLNSPGAVAVDQWGNVLVAGGGRVRVVDALAGRFYGQPMAAGHIYTIAGHGGFRDTGDGIPALKANLPFFIELALDQAGNVVIAGGSHVSVIAVKAGTFYGQQMTAGDIYTIAGNGPSGLSGNGGPALDVRFGSTDAVAVDASGNIAITDLEDSVIWVVAAATGTFYGQAVTVGDIYVVAGNGTSLGIDGLGDGLPATQASFAGVGDVAIAPSGDLLVGDESRIRSVSR